MTDQTPIISKIITNSLIKNQVISLPSIGSLSVDVKPSKLNSLNGEITPPQYIVRYDTQQNGRSIVELIAQYGSIDTQQAEAMYDAWLVTNDNNGVIYIESVGSITNNKFSILPTLNNLLNPESQKAIKLQRRRNSLIWVFASVAVCVVIGLIANYSVQWYLSKDKKVDRVAVVQPYQEVEDTSSQEIIEQVADTTIRLDCTPAPEVVENPRYRVVYGVFSIIENAQKGAELAYQANTEVIAKITPFGNKFMVSIFGTNDIAEAKSFIERNTSNYEELWIHKRRGE